MRVYRKELLEVVTKLSKMKASSSVISTEDIKITGSSEGLTVTRNNLDFEVSITIRCEECSSFEAYADAAELKTLLSKIKSDVVNLGSKDLALVLTHMKGSSKLSCSTDLNYPAFDIGETKFVTYFAHSKELPKILRYTSSDGLRPSLNCINFRNYMGRLILEATDAFKLVKYDTKQKVDADFFSNLLLPKAVVPFISDSSIYIGDKHIKFVSHDTTVIYRTVDATYPNVDSVIPDTPITAICNVPDLIEAMDVVVLSANKNTKEIVFKLKDNQLYACDLDLDKESSYDVEFVCSEELMDRSFTHHVLLPVLKDLDSHTVKLQFNESPAKALTINEGNYFFLVIPFLKYY